jgi:hypothetical protein
VLVAVNTGTQYRELKVTLPSGSAPSFTKYSTSASVNVGYGGTYQVSNGQTAFYVDPQSVATFISN